jgi:hypothetical protein
MDIKMYSVLGGGGGGNGPTALNNSHVNLLYFIVLYFLDTQGTINISDPEFKLDIKISGDGAKMSLLTNFVVISFSILNNEKDVMSSKAMTDALILNHSGV